MTGGDVGFDKPNTTQIPDEFWRLLPEMGEAEVKVTLYLLRQTFGFRREWTPQEYASQTAIMKNTGLSEQGVRNGIAAGMKACRIDRQIGPDKRGWVYRVIIRTAADPEMRGIVEPVVVVVDGNYPHQVDPPPSGPPTKLTPHQVGVSQNYPNEVDPLNIRQDQRHKPSFANAQDGCAAPMAPTPARRAKQPTEGAEHHPPSPHQLLFAAIADACGMDSQLMADVDRSNAGKLAADLHRLDVTPTDVAAAWDAERRRIVGFAEGRPVSPPKIARLRTIVGSYRKAQADGAAEDLGPGRSRDPITGRIAVDFRTAR